MHLSLPHWKEWISNTVHYTLKTGSKLTQLLHKYTLHTHKLSRQVQKHIKSAQRLIKAYTSYIMLAIIRTQSLPLKRSLALALAGWLFRKKQGDPDTVTTVDYFATKLNKENCHCFQVIHLSLLEANAEKEKIIWISNLVDYTKKTGSKLTELFFQYISYTQRLSR